MINQIKVISYVFKESEINNQNKKLREMKEFKGLIAYWKSKTLVASTNSEKFWKYQLSWLK